FPLPTSPCPQAEALPPAPAVTAPTLSAPVTEPVKIELPPPPITIAPAAAVGTGGGTTGGPGNAPGSRGGTGTGTGTGTGVDAGPGAGGDSSSVCGPSPLLVSNVPR